MAATQAFAAKRMEIGSIFYLNSHQIWIPGEPVTVVTRYVDPSGIIKVVVSSNAGCAAELAPKYPTMLPLILKLTYEFSWDGIPMVTAIMIGLPVLLVYVVESALELVTLVQVCPTPTAPRAAPAKAAVV